MRLIDADELKTAFPRSDNSTPVLVASVRATINHMPTIEPQQQWIPCKERLPEEDDMYLVTVHPRYIVPGGIQIDMLGWHEGKWNFQYFDGRDAVFPDPVIAWQPLPAPYREDET